MKSLNVFCVAILIISVVGFCFSVFHCAEVKPLSVITAEKIEAEKMLVQEEAIEK